jgi:hypothetical protein
MASYYKVKVSFHSLQSSLETKLGSFTVMRDGNSLFLRPQLTDAVETVRDVTLAQLRPVVRRHVRSFDGKFPITWDPESGIETEVIPQ